MVSSVCQVAVLLGFEGQRALPRAGEEEAGDGADEITQLPAVAELLVAHPLLARSVEGGQEEGRERAGQQDVAGF